MRSSVVLAVSAAGGYYLPGLFPETGSTVVLLVRLGAVVAAALACTHSVLRTRMPALVLAAVGVWLGSGGWLGFALSSGEFFTGIPISDISRFTGTVAEDSRVLGDGRVGVSVSLERVFARDGCSADARGTVALLAADAKRFVQGERVVIRAQIRTRLDQRTVQSPYVSYARSAGIERRGMASAFLRARSFMLDALFDRLSRLEKPAGPLLRALLTGNQDLLEPSTVSDFRRSGSSHILALSGMHLGIITAIIGWIFTRIFGRRAGFVLGLLCVAVYLFVAGIRPSLVRAALMYGVVGYAAVRSRRVDPIAILSLCFVLQLLILPADGERISFQLSYLALYGILTVSPVLVRRLAPYITRGPATLLAAGVSAQLTVSPLVLLAFGAVYPIGLVSGIVLGVVTTLFMWAGLAYLVVSALPVASAAVALAVEATGRQLISLASLLSRFPALEASLPLAVGCVSTALIMIAYAVHEGSSK